MIPLTLTNAEGEDYVVTLVQYHAVDGVWEDGIWWALSSLTGEVFLAGGFEWAVRTLVEMAEARWP